MRSIVDMDNIQIEVTNACQNDCSNCTRFCGHVKKPFMMDLKSFTEAIESVAEYPKMVGIMGGEPLLHPDFEELCKIALTKIPRSRMGLWTSFPRGKEHLAPVIAETFGNILLNDHTRSDIFHAPILVPIQELFDPQNRWQIWPVIDKCWVQNSWSASVNPKGAYFCEIAAAMAMLFDDGETAWPVDGDWWKKSPKDFKAQMEKWCPLCGLAAPLARRASVDGRDDISPSMKQRLTGISRKLDKCIVHIPQWENNPAPMAAYKDNSYRNRIAARYGMYLTINSGGYWDPHLGESKSTVFDALERQYGDRVRMAL